MNTFTRQQIPLSHLRKLRGGHSEFTDFKTMFYAIQIGNDSWLGVVGDGANGSYEWFVSNTDSFKTSNCGYGDCLVALREVLNLEVK